MNIVEQYCLTVKDVYGAPTEQLKIPDGWAPSGEFRPPQNGERILTVDGRAAEAYNGPSYPRLILKKSTTVEDVYGVPLSALSVPEGYEFTGEFRPGNRNEWVLGNDKWEGFRATSMGNFQGNPEREARLILRKLPTIKDIYGKELADLKAPDGWRFTGEFRRVGPIDIWLIPCSMDVHDANFWGADGMREPRLILEKIPATPTIREVYGTDAPAIPAGWKIKEFCQVTGSWNSPPFLTIDEKSVSRYGADPRFNRWRLVLEEIQDLSQFKWTTGPEFTYGTKLPEVPAGYKVVAFRPPLLGELYIGCLINNDIVTAGSDYGARSPRFILERL